MTKTARRLLIHMQYYGGAIADNSNAYDYSWGTLLKNGDVKWHHQIVSSNTFGAIKQYLSGVHDDEEELQPTLYELNRAGLTLELQKD